MNRLVFLLLIAASLRADILYKWTITNSGNQSASYAFSVPDFPTGNMVSSTNVTVTGYAGLPNYSCRQRSAEDCVSSIEFASAPRSFSDLNIDFGQAAMVVCWDAGASGCDTGFDIMTGATFPNLDIHQFGTYEGTVIGGYGGMTTELVITDPPSDAPEPGSAWLLLAGGAGVCLLARLRRSFS